MARVQIVNSLVKEIQKKFKGESREIVKLLRSLEENPTKGKRLGVVDGMLIKELKYKKFRFYFIVDGQNLNFLSKEEIVDLLIKFIRMSDKKNQQGVINKIKEILLKIGPEGFD